MTKWLPLIAIGYLLSGCNQRIVSYTNPKAAYKRFETYRVVNPKLNNQSTQETSLAFELIRKNIEEEMSRRNYELSAVAPDLTLRYDVTSSTRVQTTTSQSLFLPVFQVNSTTIHEAIILLEILDQNKKLVWQGSYDLRQERREKKVPRVVENAIARIFTTYPYKAGESNPDPTLTNFEPKKRKDD